jgi:hypothetical protein
MSAETFLCDLYLLKIQLIKIQKTDTAKNLNKFKIMLNLNYSDTFIKPKINQKETQYKFK